MKKITNKKLIYLCCIAALLMTTSLTKAQLNPPDTTQWHVSELSSPDAAFPDVQRRANAYFEAHPDDATVNSTEKLAYKRWEYFWRSRANINGVSQPGKLIDVLNAMSDPSKLSFQQDLAAITIDSKWKLLSPEWFDFQNMGTVTAIWDNPDDENIILIGTETSGLWKTINGGANWINITDSYAMANNTYITAAGFGVSSIAVNPTNFNEIYIATYLPNIELVSGYGANILRSTDGGATWNPLSSYTAFISSGTIPTGTYYKNMAWKIIYDNNNILYAAIGKQLVAFNLSSALYSVIFDLYLSSPNPVTVPGGLYPYSVSRKIRDLELISVNNDADRNICLTTDGINGIQAEVFHTLHSKDPFIPTPYTWIYKELPLNHSGFIDNAAVDTYGGEFYIAYDEKYTGGIADFNIATLNTTSNTLNNIFNDTHYWYMMYPETAPSTPPNTDFNGFGYRYDAFEIANINTMYVGGFDIFKIDLSQTPAVTSSLTYYEQAAAVNHLAWENFNKNMYCHNGIRTIRIIDENNSYFLVGNEGGISKYTGKFANINGSGLAITEFANITTTRHNQRDVIVGGSIRNGLWHYENGWQQFYWEDGGNSLINDLNPENIFNCSHWWDASAPGFAAHLYSGKFSRTTTGLSCVTAPAGNPACVCPSLSLISQEIIEASGYFPPLEFHPTDNTTIYLGKHNVWESTNLGLSFTAISNFPDNHMYSNWSRDLQAVKIAPSNTTVMYVAFASPTWGLDASGLNPAPTPGRKLYRGNQIGTSTWNWTDITLNVKLASTEYTLVYNGISDIAINPTNADEVWITLNQFCSYNPQEGKERVMHSVDGGTTFTEYSQGLTPAPVNCIKYYYNNGKRMLFIGTDVGVFYRDPEDNSATATWVPLNSLNNPLPRCIVSDMEISYTTNKLRIATLGRGIWETEILCFDNTLPQSYVITTNTLWDTDKSAVAGIEIGYGTTLTITSHVHLTPNAIINIAEGGKLILDGGTLAACPGEMWGGIKISGGMNSNNSIISAIVDIRNNGTIKDAVIGIENIGGGVIYMDNANFVNNQKAIVMNEPTNNIQDPYSSYFLNGSFITNDLYHDAANYPFEHFVELNNVYKLNILGCTFENKIPISITSDWTAAGKGIVSHNSVFTVNTKCNNPSPTAPPPGTPCPSQYTAKTEFKNLQYGIYATSNNPIKNFSVRNATFDNNFRGIYAMTINNAVFTNNTFKVIDFVYPGNGILFPAAYGLHLNNCSGYTVEGNNFDKSDSYPHASLGLVVHNSGNAINTVYNNNFKNIKYGATQAQNNNRGTTTDNGLKIKCNDYSLNEQDVTVTAYPPGNGGISVWQGAPVTNINDPRKNTKPAGNRFTHLGSTNTLTDYNNTYGGNIAYYHHSGAITDAWVPEFCNAPPTITKIDILSVAYAKGTACPSIAVTGGGQPHSHSQLSQSFSESTAQLNSAKLILQIWVDGGNSDGLKQTVKLAYPWEAYELYNTLIIKSPYLSDEVLIETIRNEDALPALMLKLVLLANPQAVRSDRVMEALYSRNNPFPEAWIVELKQGLDVISPRENLEADVAYYATERKTYLDLLKKHYLDDDSETAPQNLIQLLSDETDVDTHYELVFAQLVGNDADAANTTLGNIEQILPEDEAEVEKYNQMKIMIPIISKIECEGRNWEELEEEDRTNIIDFSDNNNELPGMLAKSIRLRFDSEYIYEEPIYMLKNQKLKMASDNKANKYSPVAKESFMISPNPANEFLIAEYTIDETAKKAMLLISDIQGRLQMKQQLTNTTNQTLVDVRTLKNGSYHCTLMIDGKQKAVAKIIIQH